MDTDDLTSRKPSGQGRRKRRLLSDRRASELQSHASEIPSADVADRPPVVRIRDIADMAGVAESTVSRVLNGAPSKVPFGAETRERVLSAARQLGYRPNPLARALRGAPTLLLGAVVRDFSDPFFASVLEVLAVEAMARGYNVVLGHAHGRLDERLPLTTVLETRHCDAVLILGEMQDQTRLLHDLRASTIPVVALWQGNSPIEFPTVDVDDHAGVMAAMRHVQELGHERIAFVSGRLGLDNPHRRDAYIEFMRDRFGGVPEGFVQEVPNDLPGGESAMRALASLREPPTAVVTSTDLVAVGVLHAAYTLGCTVPDELTVVGFDDLVLAAHTVPPLTTVHMPVSEIVREGIRLAIEFAHDPATAREPNVRYFEPTLVVRQSSAPPR